MVNVDFLATDVCANLEKNKSYFVRVADIATWFFCSGFNGQDILYYTVVFCIS